jgi:hypothetical protein
LEIDPEYVNKLCRKDFSSKPLQQMKDTIKTWKFWGKRKEPYYINDLLTQYFTTLNEQSISIIFQYFAKHNITLTGDANLLPYLSEESREQRARMIPFRVICGDSKMKGRNLKENVIQPLVSELEQSLRLECRGMMRDSSGSVEFFKDNEWQECVRIATKGYSIDQ